MELNKFNIDLATEFFLGNTTIFDGLDDNYKNMFMAYATDNNSSTLREYATMNFLNYVSYFKKHGADGYNPITNVQIELKPKYIHSNQKVSSSGNFNDMTMLLLEQKKDYNIVCSAFCDKSFVYIVEFPINIIYDHLKKPIENAKLGRRVVCHFGYKQYDNNDLIVHYLNEDIIDKCLSKSHAKMLRNRK